MLLPVALICCLLPAGLHGCPSSCSACSGPGHEQCAGCRAGWSLHNNTCVDVDECDATPGPCSSNAYCFNTDGAFQCRDCDRACVGCMGPGPARCRKCASGFSRSASKCLDVDECAARVLACPGLDEVCVNIEGSFRCDCAAGFTRKHGACARKQTHGVQEKGLFLFEELQEDEVEVLQQMFFGVLLCALATLAAKGDMVYTSVLIGALAAMTGYWLSDRLDRVMDNFIMRG